MVRMKLRDDEFDEKALNVKVEPNKFKRYTGDVPKTGTILIFRVTKMWWTQSEAGNSMIRVMAIAERNTGDKKKFNGLPCREYLVFTPESAWRYMPFLDNFGLTTRDIKRKMEVEPEPDTIGDVITSIAGWEVGSDDALCRIVVKRERYEDDFNAKVDHDGWLPLDPADEVDDDDDDEDDDDETPARPTTRARGRSSQAGRRAKPEPEPEDEDEDDDIDDEDEDDLDDDADDVDDDEEDDDDAEEEGQDEDEEEDEEEDEPPARPARRAKPARAAAATNRARPARGSGTTRRAAVSARSADGERNRSGGTKSRTSSRAASSKSSKGDDSDPPF